MYVFADKERSFWLFFLNFLQAEQISTRGVIIRKPTKRNNQYIRLVVSWRTVIIRLWKRNWRIRRLQKTKLEARKQINFTKFIPLNSC